MRIGEKLKQIRLRTNLTQEELASRCDLSKGFISQVERDLTSPSIATLVDILECLGTNLTEFFHEPASDKVLFRQEDAFTSENEERGSMITWIVPNAQKNKMEPILLRLRGGGHTDDYAPHAGEVFGYVTQGAVTLQVGAKRWKVRRGECFYYTAVSPYHIENHTTHDAFVLWVTTPPSF